MRLLSSVVSPKGFCRAEAGEGEGTAERRHEVSLSRVLLPKLSLLERKELPLDRGRETKPVSDERWLEVPLLEEWPPSEEFPELGRILRKLLAVEVVEGLGGSAESSSLWFLEELSRKEDPSR